jgi:hypothetical protein
MPAKLAVLNPGGKDPFQDFAGFAGPVDAKAHAPVNYHAYTACTGGAFHCKASTIPEDQSRVLVLLRRDLKPGLAAVRELKAKGKKVAVSWKESGLHQVAQQLDDPKNILLFKQICAEADAALSSAPDIVPIYQAMGARVAEFIPTPYPVDDPRWDFSRPLNQRRGILIGTREFEVPSRNHLAAILCAKNLGEPLTVFNRDGRSGRKKLEPIGGIEILEANLPYPEYLRVVARHKLVFQLDRSGVPGQVAGDALLCRIPCVGGDSAIERVAFPNLCGGGARDSRQLVEIARELLGNSERMAQAIEDSQAAALAAASYQAIAKRLERFFN